MGGTPSRGIQITELDPQAKCGARTTVEALYRVEERSPEGRVTHLVFLDRHGWYCLHGATCPAVSAVQKYAIRGRAAPVTLSR